MTRSLVVKHANPLHYGGNMINVLTLIYPSPCSLKGYCTPLMPAVGHVRGPTGNTLKWKRDYLKDRQMRTVVKSSEWDEFMSGASTSVLTVLIFLVYIGNRQDGVNSIWRRD